MTARASTPSGRAAPRRGPAWPRDPRLPARDTLLDACAMRRVLGDLLGEHGPVPLDAVEIVRAKYRPGESLRVLYRVGLGGAWHLVSCRARAKGADARPSAHGDAVPCPPLHGVVHQRALKAVFWTFPNDRRLRGDQACLDGLPLLDAVFPGCRVSLELAGYAPERAVIHRVVEAGSGRVLAYAKAYAHGEGRAARARLELLRRATEARSGTAVPRVPRVLGYDPGRDVVLIESLPGAHLHELTDAQLDAAFGQLGQALGALHALTLPAGAPDASIDDASALANGAHVLSFARPDLAEAAHGVARRLAAARRPAGRAVWTHADLNSRNWIVRDGHVGLIDFDQAGRGAAGHDVGAVLGWMRTRTLVRAWTPERESELVRTFLDGYERHHAVPPPRERRWHRAAALLLERAVRAVTRVRTDQLAVLPALIAAAAADAEAAHD